MLRTASWINLFAITIMTATAVDNSWHPPDASDINNLDRALDSDGVFGFIFNSSDTPPEQYGRYNYCNMPHVRKTEYQRAPAEYELAYVEVIHRHHKRTPYESNLFPAEGDRWSCQDAELYHYGQPKGGHKGARTFWQIEYDSLNPFSGKGINSSCSFPQITRGGLEDSWQHGQDLFGVYHDLLNFLPASLDTNQVHFRVTNNVITSEVAGMVIAGMYTGQPDDVRLHIQMASIDSLEPTYSCPSGQALFDGITSHVTDSPWKMHLDRSEALANALGEVSGIPPDAIDWHASYDRYFDNLSSRLCDAQPLPCKAGDPTKCISQEQVNTVLRLGQWEYSYIYRDAPASLTTSTALFGAWIAELAQHLREQMALLTWEPQGTSTRVLYRHNVAHDGSLSKLLSLLQIQQMVWPGMGAEIVFELYRRVGVDEFFLRVLWGGQVLRSSNPDFARFDLVPVDTVLKYCDSLVGVKGSSVPGLCDMTME